MASAQKKLTPATIATFAGWETAEVDQLVAEQWELDAISRGLKNTLETPEDFRGLSLWSKTYLQQGHLWGEGPTETAQLAAQRIPDDGKCVEVGFGYGRDLLWLAQRRGRVMGIEKSTIGHSFAIQSLRSKKREATNGNASKLGEVELILGSMKTHRFAKGSLSGMFSHRVMHLPHPENALPDIAQNMADGVKPGGIIVVSARSVHDFYQDQDKMKNIILDHKHYPRSAERSDRPGHIINYFTEQRFAEVFGPYCHIKELYLGKEPESLGNIKDGEQVYSYYMTAVMEVKAESERGLAFSNGSASSISLPDLKKLPSIPEHEDIARDPLPGLEQ